MRAEGFVLDVEITGLDPLHQDGFELVDGAVAADDPGQPLARRRCRLWAVLQLAEGDRQEVGGDAYLEGRVARHRREELLLEELPHGLDQLGRVGSVVGHRRHPMSSRMSYSVSATR